MRRLLFERLRELLQEHASMTLLSIPIPSQGIERLILRLLLKCHEKFVVALGSSISFALLSE